MRPIVPLKGRPLNPGPREWNPAPPRKPPPRMPPPAGPARPPPPLCPPPLKPPPPKPPPPPPWPAAHPALARAIDVMPIKLSNFNFFILQRSLRFRFAAITHAGDFLISRAGDAPYSRLRVRAMRRRLPHFLTSKPCPSAWKRCRSELDPGLRQQTQCELRKKRMAIRAEYPPDCCSHNTSLFAPLVY